MPPPKKRGKQNAWKPNKDDLALIFQQKANGMTNALIARHHGVSVPTLTKHAADAVAEGRELHAGILLSRMAQLGRQDNHPSTAFNAVRWQLSALHGYREEPGGTEQNMGDREAERDAVLHKLDKKLLPYLTKASETIGHAPQDAQDAGTSNRPAPPIPSKG